MQIRSIAVAVALVLAASHGPARASGPHLIILEPNDRFLAFPRVAFDASSAPLRVRVRNEGDPVGHQEIYVDLPFRIVASGGGLGTGEEKYWDIVCEPSEPDLPDIMGFMEIDVCGFSCEDEWIDFLTLSCPTGLLDASSTYLGMGGYPYQPAQATAQFTNPGPDPLTITAFTTDPPSFTAALADGSALPVTLAAGSSIDVTAEFDTTQPEAIGRLDVIAGTAIASRVTLSGGVFTPIYPGGYVVYHAPLGATYSYPLAVRNTFPGTRTIVRATTDRGEYAVTGLVGATLRPDEIAHGELIVTATPLGQRIGHVTIGFDQGVDATAQFPVVVVPTGLDVTTGDATPDDHRLDFGVHKAGSAPVEKTITLTNLTDAALPAVFCELPGTVSLVSPCPSAGLASGASVALTVRFTPTAAGDAFDEIGFVATDASVTSMFSARVLDRQLAFSPTAIGFPDSETDATDPQPLVLTNLADDPISLPITVTGAGFTASVASVTLAAQASVTIRLEFHPPAVGSFVGAVEIGDPSDADHAVIPLAATRTASGDDSAGGDDASDPDPRGAGSSGGCSTGGGAGLAMILLVLRRPRRPAKTP